MYKVAAVGRFESIAYFGAIGVETFFEDTASGSERLIKRLAKNGYAVIFVDEEYYNDKNFENESLPAVLPLPAAKNDRSEERISEYVKRAIGSDMIFEG